MITREEFIRLSLELNLFFARIMKEHSIFLEGAFTPRDQNLAQEADNFKVEFEMLLADTIALVNGGISTDVINANELVTPYTLDAERATQFYTGITIDTRITQVELTLGGRQVIEPIRILEQRVFMLNQRAIDLTSALALFKSRILNDVLNCRLFTLNYPLLIDHVLREARFYAKMLTKLQERESLDSPRDLLEQEVFWNQIMAEHAKFIRGFLDPTEEQLFMTANNFGNQFDELTKEAIAATEETIPQEKVTEDSLRATEQIRDFKATGTQGLLECRIKSIILPLLGDHVLREANHYLRILRMSQG